MNRRIVKHLLQMFFIPAASVSLAWFGHGLLAEYGWDVGATEWSLCVLLLVVLLEWLAHGLQRLPVIAVFCLMMTGFMVAPLAAAVATRDVPAFGNLLDYGSTVFAILVLSLVTLRYRIKVSVEAEANGGQTVSISGGFE